MKGRFFIALVAAIVIGLGAGAGAGALQERLSGKGGGATAATRQSPTPASGGSQGTLAGQDAGQGGSFGTVENVSSSGFALVAQTGRVQVATSSDTKVQKTADVKTADLKVGDTIVATGEQQADGTLVAASIQVGTMEGVRGMVGRMAGQFAQGARSAQAQGSGQRGGQQGVPSERIQGMLAQRGSAVAGTIESISGDTITAKTQAGSSSKVKVSSSTAVTKLAEGTLQDIKAGQSVVVTGERDSSGTLKATSIQLTPAGQTAFGR